MIFNVGNVLAIDLGSDSTLVYKDKNKDIIKGSSQVAIDIKSGEYIAIGDKALEMYGKSPENIAVVNPIQDGSISDFDTTKVLLKYYIEKVSGGFSIIQPKVVINAPSGINDIELRAIEDASIYAGAREVYILESSLAAALGAGFDINKSEGRIIVNLGAGNIEIAIISMNGIVLSKNLKFGGNQLDQRILDYIYDKYSLLIGLNTAKEIKENIGNVFETTNSSYEISGRDLLSGMPVNLEINDQDVVSAIIGDINQIINEIRMLIEKNPPELAKDILRNGIFITGGLSQLEGLDQLIEQKIGIKVVKSENPITDVVTGLKIVADNLKEYINIRK
ncbi:MAG: rod shape-determining protein [Helcococcus sp.]|nr:rod shape-determining protein [Helcococcus sp.]